MRAVPRCCPQDPPPLWLRRPPRRPRSRPPPCPYRRPPPAVAPTPRAPRRCSHPAPPGLWQAPVQEAPAGPAGRLLVRYVAGGRARVLHVHLGRRASLGRQRRPEHGETGWARVPSFVLRYRPDGDPAQAARAARAAISRTHLEVELAPDGRVLVTDRSSTGIWAGERRLPRNVPCPVEPGTPLRIGPGPLALVPHLHAWPAGGPAGALRLVRAGNGEEHAYLLLATAAPLGSAPEAALRLEAALGVEPVHALLIAIPPDGLGIRPVGEAALAVDGQRVPPEGCAPLLPGSRVTLAAASFRFERLAGDDAAVLA
ncbi:MAG: hypothetical protein KatS3mg102_2449 [Planctomycetota bacterium]|nr:MAG: hypothetical protein KatS3mg102_2449 [Planctomycetota bacterium]